jgi:hypothetical protein
MAEMGLRVYGKREGPPYPIPIFMELECDAYFCDGPTRPSGFKQTFEDGQDFPFDQAVKEGWKGVYAGRWLCPYCTGKKQKTREPDLFTDG